MGFSLLDYYVFLAVPLLMGVSVLLLLAKTRWVTLPLCYCRLRTGSLLCGCIQLN